MPRRLQEQYLSAREAVEVLGHERERSPTLDEVAASLGTSVEEVSEGLEAGRNYWAVSLDAPSSPESPEGSVQVGNEDIGMGRVEDRMYVDRLLESLSDHERRIVHLRFFEELTPAEIAAHESTSQVAVAKTLARVVHGLRRATLANQDPAHRA